MKQDGENSNPQLATIIAGVLILSFIAAVGALGSALYSRSLSDARAMAVALEHYALRTIKTADLVSKIARDDILRRGNLDGIDQDDAVAATLATLAAELPAGSAIGIVDQRGRMLTSSASMSKSPVDLSDRSWFRAHQSGADLVITEALLSRVTGRIMFILTRAVRDASGNLRAIVNIGIPSDSLVGANALPEFYDGVIFTLVKSDGGLLARSEFPKELLGLKVPVSTRGTWVGYTPGRAVDDKVAIEASEADPTFGIFAQASIPITRIFQPLLFFAAAGLPVVVAVALGIGWLLRSLTQSHQQLKIVKSRLEAVIESSHLGSWHLDIASGQALMNARWADILGHRSEDISDSLHEWQSRLHPDEAADVLAEVQAMFDGKIKHLHREHRLRHADGHWVWVLNSGCVIERDDAGRPVSATGTILDISSRRDAEDRARILMRELDHRAKNLLAVVYSMINMMRAESVPDFKTSILGRVNALGHVHSLLSGSGWQGVAFGDLVKTETAAYQGENTPRVDAKGPNLALSPAAAQAIAIVVHEWMTNSAKYGALSQSSGTVELTWTDYEDGKVGMVWKETGGPDVEAPKRKGFGTTLLMLMIKEQLSGSMTAHWLKHGAVFEVWFPAEHLRASASSGPTQ